MQENQSHSPSKSNGQALKQKLAALALDDTQRTKSARLWDVYAEIENALSAGVSQKAVVEVLTTHGLEYTLKTFRNALQRLRIKARAGHKPVQKSPAGDAVRGLSQRHEQAPTPESIKNTTPIQQQPEIEIPLIQHDPREINKITQSVPNLDELAAIGRRNRK